MEIANYLMVVEGKPKGPFSLEQLKENGLTENSFVKRDGMDDFKEAHEIDELRGYFSFQKQHPLPQYFAGFDLRLLATAIDWFIIFGIVAFFELAIVMLVADQSSTQKIIFSGALLLPLFKTFYYIYMEYHQQGTVGKKLLSIKVTDTSGLDPTLNQVIKRNFAKLLSTLIFFGGYLYLFLNKKHQTLHDKLSDTLVIKDRLI